MGRRSAKSVRKLATLVVINPRKVADIGAEAGGAAASEKLNSVLAPL